MGGLESIDNMPFSDPEVDLEGPKAELQEMNFLRGFLKLNPVINRTFFEELVSRCCGHTNYLHF